MRRRHTKAQIAAAARAWDEATLSNDYLFNRVMRKSTPSYRPCSG